MNVARPGIAAALAAAVAFATIGLPALAQSSDDGNPREFMTEHGKGRVFVPEPTTRGDWTGTWMFKSRDFYMALWLRPGDDGLEAKLQYMGVSTAEAFETDWNGEAEYYVSGEKATFSLGIEDASEDRFRGSWLWDVQFHDSGRSESGTFEAFRSGQGLWLNFVWDRLERTVRRLEHERTAVAAPVWTFRKVSKRLILWDEVPF